MKHLRKPLLLCVCFALVAPFAANAQFHPPSSGTKIEWVWGFPACDPKETQQKFTWVMDWLVSHGAPVGTLEVYRLEGPFGKSPEYSQVRFTKTGYEDAVHDYCLMLGSPSITLTELEWHFKFGDPFVFDVYRDPAPAPSAPAPAPPPANPIGPAVEGRECVFFPAVGDTSPAGTVFEGKRKVVRVTLFGAQSWWECVK